MDSYITTDCDSSVDIAESTDTSATIPLQVEDPRRGTVWLSAVRSAVLMEVLRDGGLSVSALCGGGMSCGTCHVHIAEPWARLIAPPSEDETAILESCVRYEPGTSRLSCQIQLNARLDGMELKIVGE